LAFAAFLCGSSTLLELDWRCGSAKGGDQRIPLGARGNQQQTQTAYISGVESGVELNMGHSDAIDNN